MKTKVISILSLIILLCCSNLISQVTTNQPKSEGTITVYSTPELVLLTQQWAEAYGQSHPGQVVNVRQTNESAMKTVIGTSGNICFVSNHFEVNEAPERFQVVVGREIIVPVINAKNPFLKQILSQGISREAFKKSLAMTGKVQWSSLLNSEQKDQINYYMVNDEQVKTGIAGYLDFDPGLSANVKSATGSTIIGLVKDDPYAIGFCRLTDVIKSEKSFSDNIRLLPIDKNGNGKLDYMENIYESPAEFARGVWIGKYPKSLTSNIYSVAKTQPDDVVAMEFLQWVLTSGQNNLNVLGYSDLVNSERQSQLDRLLTSPIVVTPAQPDNSLAKTILLILAGLVVIGMITDQVVRRYRLKKSRQHSLDSDHTKVFDEHHVVLPGGLYYDKTHTWAYMEQDGSVKIGLDDFMQHVTGPITRVEMKKPGEKIRKGEQLCSIIQNGKQLNLYAPVSGTIKTQNQILASNSGVINDAPYTKGWIYEIEPANWSREIAFLTMADKYRSWLRGEFTRLKDFLSAAIQLNSSAYVHVVLQDGGALQDHVLADLDPRIWEEFQRKFIDVSK